jgi:UDP-N-acetylglucosamine--N-acetylmuramyl-(pentapeptide) pyrophosphoryl-undecaprenol N-acetylglucosamine transferase
MTMEDADKRILISGGGTGGHLFPALSVADELKRRHPGTAITFVGADRGIETRLVPQAGYPLRTLPLSGMKGMSLGSRARAAAAACWAIPACVAWMVRHDPDLVIGVGGYASGPAVLAASVSGYRTMVLEQNHYPGATNRFLAGRVDAVCVPSEIARERLGGRGIVTGNPVRAEIEAVGPAPGGDVLSILVFGGSRGARSINDAMINALPRLAAMATPPRIVHQTGDQDHARVSKGYAAYPPERSEIHAFLHDMPERLAAADLVICRAGAMTLAEIAAAARPAILIPYPYAADDHQRLNAEAVEACGAAIVALDRDLDGLALATRVAGLDADRDALRAMAGAARSLAVPDAAGRIADVAEAVMAGHPVNVADIEGGVDVS